MYSYSAGSPGTFGDFGSKMTIRPEDRLRMELAAKDPKVMIPRLESDLARAEAQLAEAKALDPKVAPFRDRNIISFTNQIAEIQRQLAAWRTTGHAAGAQTPLERSLDPRPRPFYLNPIVIGGALIALALLLKK
jgi:hypothetical protein